MSKKVDHIYDSNKLLINYEADISKLKGVIDDLTLTNKSLESQIEAYKAEILKLNCKVENLEKIFVGKSLCKQQESPDMRNQYISSNVSLEDDI